MSAPANGLSPTQLRVCELAARELRDKEIAERLRASPHTVREHWRRIFRRLKVVSRTGAVCWWTHSCHAAPVAENGDTTATRTRGKLSP